MDPVQIIALPAAGTNAAVEINDDSARPRWQLETKLPQSQTVAKGVDGRAIGGVFAAVHESAVGTSATSRGKPGMSVSEGEAVVSQTLAEVRV